MDMPSGAPESSVRGFRVTRAGVAAEGSVDVASVRREACIVETMRLLLRNAEVGFGDARDAEGARKSR